MTDCLNLKNLLALFLIPIVLLSCEHNKNDQSTTIVLKGEVVLHDTMVIHEDQNLVIKPGAQITFNPGALILAYGDLSIVGTPKKKITLHAIDPIGNHRILWVKGEAKVLDIKHAIIKNGLITSYNTANHFDHVEFSNKHKLKWNDAMARFWMGSLLVENCLVNWNNQGEGLLVHKTRKPVVRNNIFNKLPDAVEYLHTKEGEIYGNIFRDNGDDAVDQNHCSKTIIRDNEFYNVKDRALELGSQSFGISDSLVVSNNLFANCKVAINIKESSDAYIENTTFINNDIHIDVFTQEDSLLASTAIVDKCVFFGGRMPISSNNGSKTILTDCITNKEISKKFGSTIYQTPLYIKNTQNNLPSLDKEKTNKESIFNFNKLGYQKN